MNSVRAYLAEFIATGLFVILSAGSVIAFTALAGEGASLTPAGLIAIAFGHGLAIFILVASIAHISGGHINPAVSIAMIVTGKISAIDGAVYVIAQILGAVLGAFLLSIIFADNLGLGIHKMGNPAFFEADQGSALVLEITMTFILVFVIFATAVDKMGPSVLAPLAIGIAVMAAHLVAVPFTGSSINPARTFGTALISGDFSQHWIYWIGPIVGAVSAGLIYSLLLQDEDA